MHIMIEGQQVRVQGHENFVPFTTDKVLTGFKALCTYHPESWVKVEKTLVILNRSSGSHWPINIIPCLH